MPPVDTLLFLACFTVVPLAMIALLTYHLVAAVRDRLAVARLRRERGWTPIDADDRALHAALEDLGVASPRARYFNRWRLGGDDDAIILVTRQLRSGGGDPDLRVRTRVTFAITGRSERAPIGEVSRREGGRVESALLKVLETLGHVPITPAGWEWAMVSGPSATNEAWSAAAGAALSEHLDRGEHLRLGARHVALAIRGRSTSDVMSRARERLDGIRAALAR